MCVVYHVIAKCKCVGATVQTLMSIRGDRFDTQRYDGATVLTPVSIRCDRSNTKAYQVQLSVAEITMSVFRTCGLVREGRSSP